MSTPEPEDRVELIVEPSLALVFAMFAFCGWLMHDYSVAADATNLTTPVYMAVFMVGLFVLVAVHEASHAAVAVLAYGHRLVRVRLGIKFGVGLFGDHTRVSTAVTAAAGPGVGLAACAVLLSVAEPWTLVWLLGIVSAVDNLANLLLVPLPGSDASRIWQAIRGSDESEAQRSDTGHVHDPDPVAHLSRTQPQEAPGA